MNKSSLTVPIGKFKGQPLDVLAQDPAYVQWLIGQQWFHDRFPQHHTIIINNFADAAETPEHNTLQAKFLDRTLLLRVAEKLFDTPSGSTIQVGDPSFEMGGVDVRFDVLFQERAVLMEDYSNLTEDYSNVSLRYRVRRELPGPTRVKNSFEMTVFIELKPSLGDEYPAVLRQVNAARHRATVGGGRSVHCAIIYQELTARGADAKTIAAIFGTARIALLAFDEVIT
jgi:hypothetical protein